MITWIYFIQKKCVIIYWSLWVWTSASLAPFLSTDVFIPLDLIGNKILRRARPSHVTTKSSPWVRGDCVIVTFWQPLRRPQSVARQRRRVPPSPTWAPIARSHLSWLLPCNQVPANCTIVSPRKPSGADIVTHRLRSTPSRRPALSHVSGSVIPLRIKDGGVTALHAHLTTSLRFSRLQARSYSATPPLADTRPVFVGNFLDNELNTGVQTSRHAVKVNGNQRVKTV